MDKRPIAPPSCAHGDRPHLPELHFPRPRIPLSLFYTPREPVIAPCRWVYRSGYVAGDDKWGHPCMSHREPLEAMQGTVSFLAL